MSELQALKDAQAKTDLLIASMIQVANQLMVINSGLVNKVKELGDQIQTLNPAADLAEINNLVVDQVNQQTALQQVIDAASNAINPAPIAPTVDPALVSPAIASAPEVTPAHEASPSDVAVTPA